MKIIKYYCPIKQYSGVNPRLDNGMKGCEMKRMTMIMMNTVMGEAEVYCGLPL
jgi:hypothetical protein